jgi:hypothetical protein
MNSNYIVLVVIVLIGLMALVTNPNQDDFESYAATEIVKEINAGQDVQYEGMQEKFVKEILGVFVSIDRKDYKVCSVFTVDDISGKRRKYLGLFTFFIPI